MKLWIPASIKDNFAAKIDAAHRAEFEAHYIFINFQRAHLLAYLTLFYPVLVVVVQHYTPVFADYAQWPGLLVLSTVFIVSTLFLLVARRYDIAESSQINVVHRVWLSLYMAMLLGFMVSTFFIVWTRTGFNAPFLLGIFSAALIFHLSPHLRGAFYYFSLLFYLVCIFTVPYSDVHRVMATVSGCLSVLISWLASSLLFAGLARDFTNRQTILEQMEALQESNAQLSLLAAQDGLTGVANRRHFDEFLVREWQRASRESHSLALIMADIDFFKAYNDNLGHQAGDDCLRRVAQTLQSQVRRPADLVARYGGEEFAVILTNTDQQGAFYVAQTIVEAMAALNIAHPTSSHHLVTLSMGVDALIPQSGDDAKDLIAAADEALYKAKASGRNKIICAAKVTN